MSSLRDPLEAGAQAVLNIGANLSALFLAIALFWQVLVFRILGLAPVYRPRDVLITGASSGIGAALAKSYAGSGNCTRLVLVARSVDRLEKVAAECRKLGVDVRVESVDSGDAESLRAVMKKYQNVDLVIANAGMVMPETSGLDNTMDAAEEIVRVNVCGTFNTIAPIMDSMRRRRTGQVAIVSSIAGFFGHPSLTYYAATKAALVAFSRGIRPVAAQDGIRFSCICPGLVDTPMAANLKGVPTWIAWMPETAAETIRHGLERDRPVIGFPKWQYFAVEMARYCHGFR
ncbi:short-chain dehydrogenase/reductase superfamily [Fimicolochytrium jonesii]|uniref:short-chain dehydrogenase/reductase superfamily n=1 Tax=Fimicolochytrium jonesii TaxID=1396493 RepID=UPI0022FEC959|nr:short-chain dehydrogenase/reductase superfamily [Fimicolochytrium jonesii]KAI8816036.1 short-chain dehydrogenase/reductase superfamily [Fimicolochytrium jonesii]